MIRADRTGIDPHPLLVHEHRAEIQVKAAAKHLVVNPNAEEVVLGVEQVRERGHGIAGGCRSTRLGQLQDFVVVVVLPRGDGHSEPLQFEVQAIRLHGPQSLPQASRDIIQARVEIAFGLLVFQQRLPVRVSFGKPHDRSVETQPRFDLSRVDALPQTALVEVVGDVAGEDQVERAFQVVRVVLDQPPLIDERRPGVHEVESIPVRNLDSRLPRQFHRRQRHAFRPDSRLQQFQIEDVALQRIELLVDVGEQLVGERPAFQRRQRLARFDQFAGLLLEAAEVFLGVRDSLFQPSEILFELGDHAVDAVGREDLRRRIGLGGAALAVLFH